MQCAQNFQWLIGNGKRCIHQTGFKSTNLSFGVPRPTVPGRGNYALVVINFGILDLDPVPQSATWCFCKTSAFGFLGPTGGFPFFDIGGGRVTGLEICN